MDPLLSWLETSALALAIRDSTLLTSSLSALHLVGMTVTVGAAIVSTVRVAGLAFIDRPVAEVVEAARRGIAIGLAISVATGLLLVAPRASAAAANTTFRIKMLIVAGAALWHFAVYRHVLRGARAGQLAPRVGSIVALSCWVAAAAAGAAYILLE